MFCEPSLVVLALESQELVVFCAILQYNSPYRYSFQILINPTDQNYSNININVLDTPLSINIIIMNNSEPQNQPRKQCIICENTEADGKQLMNLFSDKEFICRDCYAEQNQMIVTYKKNKPILYSDYHQILENLFLGNEDSAIDSQVIQGRNIRAICVCGSFLLTPFEGKQMEGEFGQISYRKLDIADYPSQKLINLFDETTSWIHNNLNSGRKVLVHCAAGVSRSASFTIAYLMKYKKMDFKESYEFVKQKRKIIRPNSGFIDQLKEYEQCLKKEKAN